MDEDEEDEGPSVPYVDPQEVERAANLLGRTWEEALTALPSLIRDHVIRNLLVRFPSSYRGFLREVLQQSFAMPGHFLREMVLSVLTPDMVREWLAQHYPVYAEHYPTEGATSGLHWRPSVPTVGELPTGALPGDIILVEGDYADYTCEMTWVAFAGAGPVLTTATGDGVTWVTSTSTQTYPEEDRVLQAIRAGMDIREAYTLAWEMAKEPRMERIRARAERLLQIMEQFVDEEDKKE
ncbi:MAG: hypothetical protein Q8P59_08880 [Dehalococcoidia bacterium]|nr:hypothetical protein [Dehalococcoidia bacterium]